VILICFGRRRFIVSILGVNGALTGAYQYTNRTQKTGTNKIGFTEQLQKTGDAADTSKVDAYTEYLRSKYGNDVVIAPNILEQMANDPKKAAYYEGKIDDFFNATPRLKASFAEQELDYQPCGVVVHEDGSVTYIGGCGNSPERVAEVNAINKAKREKEAAQRKTSMKRSQEAADERKEQMEIIYKQRSMAEFFVSHKEDMSRVTYTGTPGVMGSAITAYEKNIMDAAGILK
jgi:hypothetical protein